MCVYSKSKWWIELQLRPVTIYLRQRLRSNDFSIAPVSCNAVMELWYWHWPDGDIPEAPRLSPSYLEGPHLALYNRQQTQAKAQPVVHREHRQSHSHSKLQAWKTVGYSRTAFKEAPVYSVQVDNCFCSWHRDGERNMCTVVLWLGGYGARWGGLWAGKMQASWHVIGQSKGLFQARFVVQLSSWGG